MALVIEKAVKRQAKLKMCIAGPPGAGKTYTALTFAKELANGGKILVLDSEKGSASLYSDEFEFDTIQLWSRDKNRQPIKDPFHPRKYMEAVQRAEEGGYAVLVIDSLSHCWNDEGGFLSLNRRIAAQKYHNNTAAAWLDTDPLYREFVNTLTDARLHIVATVRSKSEIDISKNDKGETKVSKLGTKVVQRDELEFEFTIYCRMEVDNTLIVEKTRCRAINGAVVNAPTALFIQPVVAWLNNGAPPEVVPVPVQETAQVQSTALPDEDESKPLASEQQLASIRKLYEHLGKPEPEGMESLGYADAKQMIADLSQEYREARAKGTDVNAPQPTQSPAVQKMLVSARNRVSALSMEWDAIKAEAKLVEVPDTDLTVQQIATINGHITKYEKKAS